MATNFPTSLDSLTNPISSDKLDSPSHSGQHTNANDAIEALQAKVGVNGSAVTTTLDYKVAQLESSKIDKSLVDAKGDIIAASANDTPTRLPVGTNNFVLVPASGESTGLKWTNPFALPQTVETKTAAYTIQATDAGKLIRMNATANFTVDSSTGFSIGQRVDIVRIAAGACNVTQGSGATLNGTPSLNLRAQYSAASIICVDTNTYYLIGDMSA